MSGTADAVACDADASWGNRSCAPTGCCSSRSPTSISTSRSSSTPTRRSCGSSRDAAGPRTRSRRATPGGWPTHARSPGLGYWVAFRHDGEFVGLMMLPPAHGPDQPDDPRVADLGYRILRRHWRRGIASEASRALLEHAFATVGMRRVIAQTMAVNAASRGVMEAVGMSYVRTYFPEFEEPLPGSEQGEVEYELTLAEWRAAGGVALIRRPLGCRHDRHQETGHPDRRRRHRARSGNIRAPHRRGDRRADRVGRARGRRRGLQAGHAVRRPAGARSTPSPAPASSSRARWRRRSASARRAPTSRCASCSRRTPTSAPPASCPASSRPTSGRGIDLVVVRENVEDLYAGIEHMQTPGVAQCLKLISRKGCEKIVRLAFEFARAEGRKQRRLRHQGEHHEADRGAAEAHLRGDRAGVPGHRVAGT